MFTVQPTGSTPHSTMLTFWECHVYWLICHFICVCIVSYFESNKCPRKLCVHGDFFVTHSQKFYIRKQISLNWYVSSKTLSD